MPAIPYNTKGARKRDLDYADDIALFETNNRNMSDTTEAIRK